LFGADIGDRLFVLLDKQGGELVDVALSQQLVLGLQMLLDDGSELFKLVGNVLLEYLLLGGLGVIRILVRDLGVGVFGESRGISLALQVAGVSGGLIGSGSSRGVCSSGVSGRFYWFCFWRQ